MSLLWTLYFTLFSSVSIVDFEQVNIFWVSCSSKEVFNVKIFQSFSKQFFSIPLFEMQPDFSREIHASPKNSCTGVFCKKKVIKNFPKSIEKHLCRSLFLIKLQTWGLEVCNFSKEAPVQVSFCYFCKDFRNIHFVKYQQSGFWRPLF